MENEEKLDEALIEFAEQNKKLLETLSLAVNKLIEHQEAMKKLEVAGSGIKELIGKFDEYSKKLGHEKVINKYFDEPRRYPDSFTSEEQEEIK